MLAGVACGDDKDDNASTGSTTTAAAGGSTTTAASGGAEEVVVTAEDYKFVGLPETVKVGTKLTFENDSAAELHELVAVPIPATETRSIEDLVKLPEDELNQIFGQAQPAMVLVRAPGEGEMIAAVGDGTFTAPGRYAIFCSIPVGADPAKTMAAMQEATEGPPTTAVGAGPPHFTQGMYAEVTVED